MTGPELEQERRRLALLALDITAQRGRECTRADLAAEARLTRARVDMIFPDEEDLFDTTTEHWFDPEIAIMEDVVAADLPANRKLYEFFLRRFERRRVEFARDPGLFRLLCELGEARLDRVSGYLDLADHYLCEIIAQAQVDGYFAGLDIEEARALINQTTMCYTMPSMIWQIGDRLSPQKLARIIDTLFAGLSAADGGSGGTGGLRAA